MPGRGSLAGRVAIVTGGTSGIGLAVARRLLEDGAKVALVGRDPERGTTAVATLAAGDRLRFLAGDVSHDSSELTRQVAQDWNQLHILVNCAGFTLGPRPLSEITDGDWAAIEATNLRGTFQMTRAATALMGANGSVVCVSSISGRGFRGATNAAYAATKGGIVSFVQAAALELGSKHIRINCVCPGPTRTETFDAVVRAKAATEGTTEQAADNSLVQSFNTAMGRIVDASEVASVVSFLASDDASGVTGQSINVDAGLVFD